VLASYGAGRLGEREGWTFGGGLEALLGEKGWSLGLEYRYTALDDEALAWSPAEASVAGVETDLHAVIARLNYRF
jgi:opacity protein-like surface antigen